MQRSFGAQNLYIPSRYKQGTGSDEPCDLFWCSERMALLFYFTSGRQKLEKQERHNLRQSIRWIKRWLRIDGPSLVGTNRFGDAFKARGDDIDAVVSVSVVSDNIGIAFHRVPHHHKIQFSCTISDRLLHSICQSSGTIADLLSIIELYAQNMGSLLLSHRSTGPDRLEAAIRTHEAKIEKVIQRFHDHAPPGQNPDLTFISNVLGMNRMPDCPAWQDHPEATRRTLSSIFADMSASDYLLLASACVEVIKRTENQRLTVFGGTEGMYLNWNIVATSIRARNMSEHIEAFFNVIKGTKRETLPLIVFGHDLEGADYRGPMLFALPPRVVKSQVRALIDLISTRLAHVIRIRQSH